jgi:hypothetical protein
MRFGSPLLQVTAVPDGLQALNALKASYAPGGQPFHIALLDMQARGWWQDGGLSL